MTLTTARQSVPSTLRTWIVLIGILLAAVVAPGARQAAPQEVGWTVVAPGLARYGHATALLDGKLYSVGGYDYENNDGKVARVYDPATDSWTVLPPLRVGRAWFRLEAVGGKLYALGGASFSCEAPWGALPVEMYDPVAYAWTDRASLDPRALTSTPSEENLACPDDLFGFGTAVINDKI